ncbi:hypothetical protein B0T16DRAFT_398953 [Cercophora newfieldiana]|uniref:Uncharacterized protein n=1 Tax=Cercophora newfieldiana TaxID=92897 RepID=A0AA39YPD9_9PEZI|nr:hypothetical protein B0T16DRAFT_398953 [Cercophora newfieldiana]
MVSFFGLKFGDKKKKSESKNAGSKHLQGWEIIDRGLDTTTNKPNQRPDTALSQDFRSPYGQRNLGHGNLAASSMLNLRSDHGRKGSMSSLKFQAHASDANIRTRFAAHNGSSTSLAAPAPAFGSRFRAANGSSSSLAAPGPGFSSRLGAKNASSISLVLPAPVARPSTSAGGSRGNEWGSPRDAHFLRSPVSGPPTPKSPLGDMQLPLTPRSETDNSSVFGEEADDMVENIMASVQEKIAKEKATAAEKRREMPRLGSEEERRRGSEAAPAMKASPEAHVPTSPGPVFRGNADQRPSSRGGLRAPPGPVTTAEPIFRGNFDNLTRPGSRGGVAIDAMGPPQHGPPTQQLPQPPSQAGHRRGSPANAHSAFLSRAPIRANSSDPDAELRSNSNGNIRARRLNSDDETSGAQQSQSLALAGSRINTPVQEFRSQSPAGHSPVSRAAAQQDFRPHSPIRSSAIPRGLSATGSRSQSPAPSILGLNGYRRQGSGTSVQSPAFNEPTLRDLMAQSPEPMTYDERPGSRSSDEGGVIEQYARPVIQSVQARRDTLTLNSPRRVSLSMEIEELEKSLAHAQKSQQQSQQQSREKEQHDDSSRASMTSSFYSEEAEENTEPVVTLQPAPLRSSPPLGNEVEQNMFPSRELSPMRGSFILRRGPRRPTLDEYGATTSQRTATSRPYAPASGSISPAPRSAISPSPRSGTLQFHQPNRTLSPAPTLDPPPSRQRPTVSTVIDAGFKFDFGPNIPPTPDSATWPLVSPCSPTPPTEEPVSQQDAGALQQKVPPPLQFDFSPDGYSRDPALWTPPPPRSTGQNPAMSSGRPSVLQGPALMPPGVGPPSRSRTPVDGIGAEEAAAAAAALGVGLARGPSMRADPRRHRVDEFGTGFI